MQLARVLTLLLLFTLTAVPISATETVGVSQRLILGSAQNGVSASIGSAFLARCRESVIYIVWTSVDAGQVTVETAHDLSYGGTWAPLAVVNATGVYTRIDVVQVTGIHAALRTRISNDIINGLVRTWVACN
jgi:flavin-binding protein dodecin